MTPTLLPNLRAALFAPATILITGGAVGFSFAALAAIYLGLSLPVVTLMLCMSLGWTGGSLSGLSLLVLTANRKTSSGTVNLDREARGAASGGLAGIVAVAFVFATHSVYDATMQISNASQTGVVGINLLLIAAIFAAAFQPSGQISRH